MIKVISMRDPLPDGYTEINTTSKANNEIDRTLSPFHLGPIALYDGMSSVLFENAWQYCKVYPQMQSKGAPTGLYLPWAKTGWNSKRANRYPMGKGALPSFSWWDGRRLSYIEARKVIYVPLYLKAVIHTPGYQNLLKMIGTGHNLALRDFDGYDRGEQSLTDVLNDPHRRMGHAFCLEMLLSDDPALRQCEW